MKPFLIHKSVILFDIFYCIESLDPSLRLTVFLLLLLPVDLARVGRIQEDVLLAEVEGEVGGQDGLLHHEHHLSVLGGAQTLDRWRDFDVGHKKPQISIKSEFSPQLRLPFYNLENVTNDQILGAFLQSFSLRKF